MKPFTDKTLNGLPLFAAPPCRDKAAAKRMKTRDKAKAAAVAIAGEKEKDGVAVLSLCDGMACAYAALKLAKIPVKAYYAVELASEKLARAIADHHHPDIIRPCNDVTKFGHQHLAKMDDPIDIVIAGFPCQPFSTAGKRKNFKDERGQIIHHIMRIIDLVKPRTFLLENVVPQDSEIAKALNEIIGCELNEVNSAAYGAQHRKRAFWCPEWLPAKRKSSRKVLRDILHGKHDRCPYDGDTTPFFTLDKPRGDAVKIIGTIRSPDKPMPKFNRGLRTTEQVVCVSGKAPALLASTGSQYIDAGGGQARKLTTHEQCRLQNLPDNYIPFLEVGLLATTKAVSQVLGNGFDIAVVADLLEHALALSAGSTGPC